jgi:hypothetical protein
MLLFYGIVIGGFLVGVFAIVNIVGLLVQSEFYYVCKSYHRQGIDRSVLHDHFVGRKLKFVLFLCYVYHRLKIWVENPH